MLPLPARFARANATEDGNDSVAKSCLATSKDLLCKGKAARHERDDPPTARAMLTLALLAMAPHYKWDASAFDVEATILTGLGAKRNMLLRSPARGLPGVKPGSLIRAKKGWLGIPETPRLRYLRLVDVMKKAGRNKFQDSHMYS